MQWHWGNIGSAAAGLATLIVTGRLLWSAPDWYRTWKEREQAERDLAREQAGQIRLERRAHLNGWSGHGIDTYEVALVTDADELAMAARELGDSDPSAYVVLRAEHANLALSLRHMIEKGGRVSRAPSAGEREALEKGLEAMGVLRAEYG